jgi:transcriptional regulator with XRE-family HTH domain
MLDKIKELCKKRGLSVSQLEQELGFGNKAIYKWDEQTPGIDRVKKVADYFGVTIDYLVNDEKTYDEKEELLEKAFGDKPEMRVLFKVTDKCSPAEIKTTIRLIAALRGEPYED